MPRQNRKSSKPIRHRLTKFESLEPRRLLAAGAIDRVAKIGPINLAAIAKGDTALTLSPLSNAGSAAITGEQKTWHKITFTWDGPSLSETSSDNPFLDYRINATFTGPSNQVFVVPGFFAADGNAANTSASSGDKWRVYFAPDEPGQWSYAVAFKSGDDIAVNDPSSEDQSAGFFDGDTGTFTVTPTDKSGRDFRGKGRLQYVGDDPTDASTGHYLRFAESGEYFLKQGPDAPENFLAYDDFDNTPDRGNRRKSWSPHADDWNQGDPSWQNGKGTEIIGAINYLADEGLNAFSFLTMSGANGKGDDKNVFMWLTDSDFQRFDVSKLDQWGIVLDHGTEQGMYLHFKTQETENDKELGGLSTNRKLYYRELVARFGHNLALNWNLGEENTNSTQERRQFAEYFRQVDPYDHHIVIHTYPGQDDSVYTPLLGNDSELTGASLQLSRVDFLDVHDRVAEWVGKSAAADNGARPWVVAVDEPGDANWALMPDDYSTPQRANNQEEGRMNALWGTFMAGGAGNEWYFGYEAPESDLTLQDFRSRDRWWDYNRFALEFFYDNNVPFWQMQGDNSITSADYGFYKSNDTYVIYDKSGGTADLDLSDATGTFEVLWFDPRNGGALQAGSVAAVEGGGTVDLGDAPDSSSADWAILVRQLQAELTAIAGPDQIVVDQDGNHTETITLDGSSSFDPEGLITSYSWTLESTEIATGSSAVIELPVGRHEITLTVTDGEANSDSDTILVTVRPAATQVPGLLGEYFNETDLSGLAGTRVDATVDFQESDFGDGPSGLDDDASVTPDDNFSERWTGFVRIDEPGDWTFYTTSNDGVRLWVNEQQLIDNWDQHAATEDSQTINLAAGWYPIRLEHFQQNGTVVIELRFSGPGQSKAIIPSTNLATNIPIAPKVETISYGDSSAQRSIIRSVTVNFDTAVILDSGAFELTTQSGTIIPLADPVVSTINGKTSAVLTFSGDQVDSTGSLIDGNYRLTIFSSRVRDLYEVAYDGDDDGSAGGDSTDDFFRVFGDSDGDGDVDGTDFLAFRDTFRKRSGDPRYNWIFDIDNDGDVDGFDFLAFRNNFRS
ncbi:MAG: PA14 domain-containing protein [Planctomycetota bacterium]